MLAPRPHVRMPALSLWRPDWAIARQVLGLAYPVVLSMLSRTLLMAVDTAMVGRLGADALAAVGVSGTIFFLIFGVFIGLSTGVQALVARRFGEGDRARAGQVAVNGILFGMAAGTLAAALGIYAAPLLFGLVSRDPAVAREGVPYLRLCFAGVFLLAPSMAMRGFFNGIGRTKIHLAITATANAANVVLNYALIFGHFGAPRMGVTGAGVATLISTILAVGILVFFMLRHEFRVEYGCWRWRALEKALLGDIVRLSLPSAAQFFLVELGFLIFIKLIGLIGTAELAVARLIFTIEHLSFMQGVGLGIASGSLVGRHLGARRPELAWRSALEAARMGAGVMITIGACFILFPQLILRVFTSAPELVLLGSLPIQILGAIQVFDAFGLIFANTLQGVGLTRWVALAEVCINWLVFLPVCAVFILFFHWGIAGATLALAIYICCWGATMTAKFFKGDWVEFEV